MSTLNVSSEEDGERGERSRRWKEGGRGGCLCRSAKKGSRLDEGGGLLPGLPDAIALDLVVPKLPWSAFGALAAVSRPWRESIRSHRVREARFRSNSTEKLFLLNHKYDGERAISLFSPRDSAWLRLPMYPKSWESQKGMPFEYGCISLDGNLYVMGGVKQYGDLYGSNQGVHRYCNEVYVQDLAGNREWKQCTSLPEPRRSFGCGVLGGKIYVLGGLFSGKWTWSAFLVYEPKANTWSSIRPMKLVRYIALFSLGEELVVHGNTQVGEPITEVYHRGRNEWRTINLGLDENGRMFLARGNLYFINEDFFYKYDNDSAIDIEEKNASTIQHSYRLVDESVDSDWGDPAGWVIEAADDELLGLLWFSGPDDRRFVSLFRSKGFGGQKQEISWDRVSCDFVDDEMFTDFMCPVQL